MATEAIQSALGVALREIADERAMHAAMLDNLTSYVVDAVAQHDAGNMAVSHERCRQALDLAHVALGDCESVEPLTALLGYDEPDDDLG